MTKKSIILFPKTLREIESLGTRIREARLRRKFSMETVCKRADISRPTLKRIETGDPSVSFGNLVQVLKTLGFQNDIALLVGEDVIGRKIQDESLPLPRRSPRRTKPKDQ